MNRKALLTISALALGLFPMGLPTHAGPAMSGMDMAGGTPTSQKPAPLSVTATLDPAAPRTGDNTLDLTIRDAGGKPATGLKLTATVAMTSMDMGTTHPAVTETGGGHYTTKVVFGMDGPWRVVVRNGGNKVAVLDFQAGAKTARKSPQSKAAAAAPGAPAVKTMPGMDMDSGANPSGVAAPQPDAPAKSAGAGSQGSMPGMDMGSTGEAGMSGMKTGIADMKTAAVPHLQEMGTYTATGGEDWKAQTGFGHNSGMVGMMNQMMVGGSGMEGMKMPAMNMKFGKENYAKPEAGDVSGAGDMAGMDMGGGKAAAKPENKPDSMAGMKMDAAAPAAGPQKVTVVIATPKAGDNALQISVADAQGRPVTGAKIATTVAMTSMDMGTTHPAVTETGSGHYAANVTFSMAGPWRVTLSVAAPGQKPMVKTVIFNAK